ncbi:hypothetical protein [Bradyrhizobium sp. OAE829]|uniref:hypothetical protein n=1 Tax=Bradyrhizobium sp. OAE829 TaxID=2663807 RepID=UPI001789EC70
MTKEKLLADLFCSGKNDKDGAVTELKAAFEKHLAETESQIEWLAHNARGGFAG